jgi:uncharacterized protein YndB with AHSA1/START domain
MPSFADTGPSPAPPEEVWKLLCDPSRFPDWWPGADSLEVRSVRDGNRLVISCQVSGVRFEWRLEPDNDGTRIDVLVDIPEEEAFRVDEQREEVRASLVRLAEVAAVAPL